jgi:hypothetical protein
MADLNLAGLTDFCGSYKAELPLGVGERRVMWQFSSTTVVWLAKTL